jgi:orotidine-5'-phosphate decarboxylase
MAFYETEGAQGISNLMETIKYIPDDTLAIVDAKRSDIGNTSTAYAKALFDTYGADAATINPYMGYDTIDPYLEYDDKGIILLCRTSNLGARDFQDHGNPKLFIEVARKAREWNKKGNIGVVVGATYPDDLKTVRSVIGDEMPILIPGIGVQGGDISDAVNHGANGSGMRAIINSSRGIIFASKYDNYAEAAGKKAHQLNEDINRYR